MRLFESPDGELVLAELVTRFGGYPYVKGGHEAERETCRRIGRKDVIEFLLHRINQAQSGEHEDVGSDNGIND